MMNKILVYAQRPAETWQLIRVLKHHFEPLGIHIEKTDAHGLHGGILRRKDVKGFVLPGIVGETSQYTDQIGQHGLDEISDCLQSGQLSVLFTVCAGTYFISKETRYKPEIGPTKSRTLKRPLFDGLAKGPTSGLLKDFKRASDTTDLDIVRIRYRRAVNDFSRPGWDNTEIAYGNGPVLYPHREPENFEVLAKYRDLPGKPAAAACFTHGKGMVLMWSVLPYIEPCYKQNFENYEQLSRVNERLRRADSGRKAFLNMTLDLIQNRILSP